MSPAGTDRRSQPPARPELSFWRAIRTFVVIGFGPLSGSAAAATVAANFASASQVPVSAASYSASGDSVILSLNFAPAPGTTLTIVRNTGIDFIVGTFTNLSQGQQVNLAHGGITYKFVANYYGGTGNDLVLQWAYRDVYAWGNNSDNQLGFDSYFDSIPLPVLIKNVGPLSGKRVMKIAAGAGLSLALCTDGTVVAFGKNSSGQLGEGTQVPWTAPVAVNTTGVLAGKYVVDISTGGDNSLALCSDGTVVAWGFGGMGQLGNNSLESSSVPVAVDTSGALAGKTVVAISAGYRHSLALCSDGTAVAWGYNHVSQLGNGNLINSAIPVAVGNVGALAGKSIIAVQAGSSHSLALCSDGTVAAWGVNTSGQLGNGVTTASTVPVEVINTGVLLGKTVKSIGGQGDQGVIWCADGTVAGWGANDRGQLGDGSIVNRSSPVLVSATGALSGKAISAVSAGFGHSLAVCTDGTLAAWGNDPYGTLGGGGDGDGGLSALPVALTPLGALQGKTAMLVAAGGSHSVVLAATALSSDSTLSGLAVSHGTPDYDISRARRNYTVCVAPGTSSVTVTPTVSHSEAMLVVNGMSLSSGAASPSIPLSNGTGVIQVVVTAEDGSFSTYAITIITGQGINATFTSGSSIPASYPALDATGLQASLSLAHSPAIGADLTVVEITGLSRITGQFANLAQGQEISFSYGGIVYRFCVDYHGGTGNDLVLHWLRRGVCSWGGNAVGQLGNGNVATSKIPVDVTNSGALSGKTVNSVSAGGGHTLALCSDGKLVAWGNNSNGQLGNGSSVSSNVPVAVSMSGVLAGRAVVSISAGTAYSLALCSDGTIAAWGSNTQGQLGDGTKISRSLPVRVFDSGALSGRSVVAVSAGNSHSLALCSDGTVVAWGQNSSGQLGNNSSDNSIVPVLVDTSGVLSGRSVVSISTGDSHSLALCSDGGVAAWGYNNVGQLGDGGAENRYVPIMVDASGVLSGKTVASISAGSNFSLAIRSDGAVVAWGGNSNGQLGNNGAVSNGVPVLVDSSAVLSGKSAVFVTAGGSFTVAACSDGTVAAWGGNSSSQLGNNSTVSSQTPVLVSGFGALAGRVTTLVDSGSSHTVAVTAIPPGTELSELVLNEATLSPVFSAGVTEYFVHVSNPSTFAITATTRDASPLRVDGTSALSGTPFPLSPASGLSTATVQVGVAGGAVSNYKLTVVTGDSLDLAFGSASEIPLQGEGFDFSGIAVNFSLGFHPIPGTGLVVAKHTGFGFTSGKFTNLPRGRAVDLSYGGRTYHFVANYYGGTGNDLVLEWANRSVASWGCSFVQFSDGSVFSQKVPITVERGGILQGKTVVSIASSSAATTVALCADGTLVQWRGLGAGIIGDAPPVQTNVPTEVSGTGALLGKQVISATTGSGTSLALCSDGTLAAWGYNAYGQFGDGTTTNSDVPVTVISRGALVGKTVVSVAVGATHCLALCSDGTMVSWGQSAYGQLGNGNSGVGGLVTDPPVQVLTTGVLAGKKVVAIGAGSYFSLALCSDGTLVSWGDAGNGRLGNGYNTGRFSSPVLVKASGVLAGKTVSSISVGGNNNAALCSDGSVAVWGFNEDGQLGIGTTVNTYEPVAINRTGVLAGKSIISVVAGDGCMFATCADGFIAAWGRNTYGQLGDGTFTGRKLPVLVDSSGELYGKKVIAVASGGFSGHSHAVLAEPDDGFIAWMSGRTGVSKKTLSGDSDQDGIPNLMEYVLNGNPAVSSTTILPTTTTDGADFVFHFNRLVTSASDTNQIFQYSTDMIHWTELKITTPTDAAVMLGAADGNGNQPVTVTVPKAANSQMFGRLMVSKP